jgi:formate dehydrogenase subunit gamma
MQSVLRQLMRAAALALTVALPGVVLAQAASAAAPNGFVAAAEPKADESNAVRGKTQPGNNAPFWRGVRDSGAQAGTTNLPGPEMGTLVQSFTQYPGSRYTTAGEAWRQVRNQWILPYGGALLLIAVLAVGLYHWRTGGIGGHEGNTGRLIERFTYFERAAHWAVAISFVILAVSGLVMALGKFVLLPILGATLFGWLSYALKTLHNFAGPVFTVALLVFIVGYLRDNLPRAGDLAWLSRAGGMLGGDLLPSGRFNAGEKVVFWGGVIVLGLTVVASGLVLNQLVPGLANTRSQMQIANIVHGVSSFLMMAMFVGHIYMGTLGVKGAYQAMTTGYVDEAWAKEHHGLWHDDIKAGRVPAIRSGVSVPEVGAAPRAQT